MKYVDQIDVRGKKVFVRADLNVPLNKDLSVADDTRIKASLPTINYVLDNGGYLILASHLGRPDGKRQDKYSLAPVAKHLEKLLGKAVMLAPDCIGEETANLVKNQAADTVVLLENVRFHTQEEDNDDEFAKQLGSLATVYVNDAFATAHRAHASTSAITNHVEVAVGGFTLKNELEYFDKAFANPERPFIAIFGGAKVSTKMKAIKNVAQRADVIIIGGAMANTFVAAEGYNVGSSLYEKEQTDEALKAKDLLEKAGCKLLLPVDYIVGKEFSNDTERKTVSANGIEDGWMALDIGPKTVEIYTEALNQAKTIVWNGPMGAFEMENFASGTYAIVDNLVSSKALTVVGGGDTDLALHRRHALDKMSYVSTAGGAFLTLLEGEQLPAVVALENKQ